MILSFFLLKQGIQAFTNIIINRSDDCLTMTVNLLQILNWSSSFYRAFVFIGYIYVHKGLLNYLFKYSKVCAVPFKNFNIMEVMHTEYITNCFYLFRHMAIIYHSVFPFVQTLLVMRLVTTQENLQCFLLYNTTITPRLHFRCLSRYSRSSSTNAKNANS